ncbi:MULTISPECIES: hypothetical protein [Aerococcus]|uniref:hypothetical protein n=1 Tax=Aerococcus TaxID=1375 RepID=UPI0018A7D2DF|nr:MULTISPECIES: hypothetical protein [Aerococcus]MCY3067629.1 hypothetical protein [Aerococcus mictus]MCY3080469.1 hypothetical protein [Aerococcus mictus]MDK8484532.1 hypothetical protein [Aerococcus urinae]
MNKTEVINLLEEHADRFLVGLNLMYPKEHDRWAIAQHQKFLEAIQWIKGINYESKN